MQSTTIRLPKFSIEKLSPVTMCSERNPGFSGGIWSEMSSVVLRLPEGRVAMVSTNKSGAYRMRDRKTFMDSEPYDCSTLAMVSKGNYNAADGRLLDPDEVPRYPYWKLNYYGAYDFYVANGVIHAFMHGENKNERLIVDGRSMNTAIRSNRTIRSTGKMSLPVMPKTVTITTAGRTTSLHRQKQLPCGRYLHARYFQPERPRTGCLARLRVSERRISLSRNGRPASLCLLSRRLCLCILPGAHRLKQMHQSDPLQDRRCRRRPRRSTNLTARISRFPLPV